MANDFLNKVYDRYEHRDFAVTDDNLNPLREIRSSSTKNQDDDIDKTLSEVSKKLLKIKETYKTAIFETEEDPDIEASTSPSELVSKSKTINDLKNSILAGGDASPGAIFGIADDSLPSDFPVIDALIGEIDKMLVSIISGLPTPPQSKNGSDTASGGSSDNANANNAYNYDFVTGDRFNCSSYDTDADGIPDITESDGTSDAYVDDNDDGSSDGSGSSTSDDSSDDSSDSNSSTDNNGSSNAADEIDSLWDDSTDAGTTQAELDDAAAECAINQLGILKAILVILKIIKIYQMIMTVIGAIIQIINIVQLAAGAWLNPTNFAKIAQIIAQLAIALLAQIISRLIQLLWDMLNEECSVKQAMSVWNEIISSMNAAGKVFDETQNAISLTQNNIIAAAKAKNHLEELQKELEEKLSLENMKKEAAAWKKGTWDDIKNTPSAFAKGLKEGFKDATKDIYGQYVPDELKSKIQETVDAANSLSKKYEKLSNTKVKTPAVEKALASLKGLKEE